MPKHIHVTNSSGFAKIELKSLKVVQNYFKAKDLKFVLEIVRENRNDFERSWDEWFNQR